MTMNKTSGARSAKESEASDAGGPDGEMIKVALKRTYGFGGQVYGPGESVEVPLALAVSLQLAPGSPPKPVSE